MMSSQECAVFFTAKSIERLLAEGGTSSWRLDRNNARKCEYAICTRNAEADWVEGSEPHHEAFLIGRVKDVVQSRSREDRWCVLFSEFARVAIPNVWQGDRNPVRYRRVSELENLGLDFSKLKWEPIP